MRISVSILWVTVLLVGYVSDANAGMTFFGQGNDDSRIYVDYSAGAFSDGNGHIGFNNVAVQTAVGSQIQTSGGITYGSQAINTATGNSSNPVYSNTSDVYYFNNHDDAVAFCGNQEAQGNASICQGSSWMGSNSQGQFQINVPR